MKWSGSPVEYSLEGEFPEMLFTINREGIIYLNAPLDRETQDQVKDKKLISHFYSTKSAKLCLNVMKRETQMYNS